MKIDKRRKYWRNRYITLAKFTLGVLIALIMYALLSYSIRPRPLISPLSDVNCEVWPQSVSGVRIQPCPTATPKKSTLKIVKPVKAQRKYTYFNYANKPHYQDIMFWLQNNYVEFENAAELVGKESGFNSYAINPTSGACGLAQANPCKRMGCDLGDIKCQLEWQKSYIAGRHGTVTKALEFHDLNGWY